HRGATRRRARTKCGGDSRRVRGCGRRPPKRRSPQRCRGARGWRPCRRSAGRARACARGRRLRGGGAATRAADRVLTRDCERLMGRFRDALATPGLAAIAEVKRRSPSAGDLRPDADPADLAAEFAAAGAAAVSILVDARFAGSLDDLRGAREAAQLPLLAKGFFTEERQLEELEAAGADAALLILRDLDDRRAAA